MTIGSLREVRFRVKNLKTRKIESIMVETAHSNLADLATGRGWAAGLNGFDESCAMADGKTEGEAIAKLLEMLDLKRLVDENL